MLPVWGTSAILVAPSAPVLSTGFVAGNTLPAQWWNFQWFHLTKELNNLLTAVGIGQSASDDTQLTQAVGLNQISISASGTTVASAFKGDTWTKFSNSGGASTYDISAGASRSGVRLTIEETNANGVTIKTGTGMTAVLGIGAIQLLWDGTQWVKIGGATILVEFTSGTGATWLCPWSGSYKVTVVGGGGAGGGWNLRVSAGTGDGAGGYSQSVLYEAAGATFTYTVGPGGVGGNTDGPNGSNSSLSDGVATLICGGGKGGVGDTTGSGPGGNGGTATGGNVNIPGNGGGCIISATVSGFGGASVIGDGGIAVYGAQQNGVNGGGYGGGGSGAIKTTTGSPTGGSGAGGVVLIEF